MEDKHFDKVFWFISSLVLLVLLFDTAVIFVPVPAGGQKYADILVGSLNTGALMACINYLLGGNPTAKKPDTITGKIQGTINPTKKDENPISDTNITGDFN